MLIKATEIKYYSVRKERERERERETQREIDRERGPFTVFLCVNYF